ncbi:MAG: BsuPI-related putative proteinase inhibitor [Gemmatimonadaceae bacterium]
MRVKSVVTRNEFSVRFSGIVWNATPHELILRLGGASPEAGVDYSVADSAGRVVWRRDAGRSLFLVLMLIPVASGDSITFFHDWNLRDYRGFRLAPGRYCARARAYLGGNWADVGSGRADVGNPQPFQITP